MSTYRIVLAAALLTLAAIPATAIDLVLESGLDVWITRGDGSTFYNFANDPLPADFFCSGSDPFDGVIVFKGVPVATAPRGALGGSDTILQRLDHGAFDDSGVAVTRLQVRALHFEGVELLRTWCGEYRVEVVLDGEQPVTEMRIYRDLPRGGHFEAEVAVNAKLVFTPVGHAGEVLEVGRSVVFPPRRNSSWSERPGRGGVDHEGFVRVDTDNNGRPDTFLPGTSRNFAAGWPGEKQPGGGVRELARSAAPQGASLLTQGGVVANLSCSSNCHCDPGCGNHCLCPPGQFCEPDW